LCAQAGDLSPICFDLPQFSHRSKNRHKKKLLSLTQTFAASELVFFFAFSCPAFSAPPVTTVSGSTTYIVNVRKKRYKCVYYEKITNVCKREYKRNVPTAECYIDFDVGPIDVTKIAMFNILSDCKKGKGAYSC